MKKALEPILGIILSTMTWEKWENLLIALLVALLGGFLGSLGKSMHLKLKEYLSKKKRNANN